MEPASSDSENDFSSSDEEEQEYGRARNITSLDDLPSDDSVSVESNNGFDLLDRSDRDKEEEVNLSLAERLDHQRNAGLTKVQKRQRAQKKHEALKVASERLRKKKTQSKKEAKEVSNDNIQDNRKKKSKHAPTEASSKRKDFYQRGAPDLNSSGVGVEIGSHRYKPRDPRLQSLCGHLDMNHFERNFAFLEEMRDREITQLQERIKARKVTGRKGQKLRRKLNLTSYGDDDFEMDKEQLSQLLQERATYKRLQVERAAKSMVKRKVREEVTSGKRAAFYLNRKEKKAMEVEAKYEELRKRGGDAAIDKALAKRRKKNLAKDHKFMPKAS